MPTILERTSEIQTPEEIGLSQSELQELKKRYYHVLKRIDNYKGKTGDVYLVEYQKGKIRKLRVLKIEKKEVDPVSIGNKINQHNMDLFENEVESSNQINEPGFVESIEDFRLKGRKAIIQAYRDKKDLETRVETWGPIKDRGKFVIFSDNFIDRIDYLNRRLGFLHRDIKPDNTFIDEEGRVDIGDLQNTKKIRDIKQTHMPTRGGSAYTKYDLLNALIGEETACADKSSEAFSVTATLYYSIVGKHAIPYKTVTSKNGRLIEIDGETYKVGLKYKDKDIEKITEKEHIQRAKQAVKEIPKEFRRYKKFFYKGLTNKFNSVYEMKEEFNRINTSYYHKVRDKLTNALEKSITPLLLTSATVFIGGLILAGLNLWTKYSPPPEFQPTISEIVQNNLEELDGNSISLDNQFKTDLLMWYFRKSKKAWGRLDENIKDEINARSHVASNIARLDRRLIKSWLAACYLSQEKGFEDQYKKNGQKRLMPLFVPENFFFYSQPRDHMLPKPDSKDLGELSASGVDYLKLGIIGARVDERTFNANPADIFARYFCITQEDINTAKARTNSVNYLPTITEKGNLEIGYYRALEPYQQDLINTALAIYYFTDPKTGKTHWDKARILAKGIGTGIFQNLSFPVNP